MGKVESLLFLLSMTIISPHVPSIFASVFPANISICAMVRNEMPMLIEWILYYHLLGVQHFMIFDDYSSDDTVLLPSLFTENGYPVDMLQVFTANIRRRNQHFEYYLLRDRNARQENLLQFCHKRLLGKSEWILNVDVDEFIVPSYNQNLPEFIRRAQKWDSSLSFFYFLPLQFGTNGMYNIDKIQLSRYISGTSINRRDGRYPLIIEKNTFRAPHKTFEADYQSRFNKTCITNAHLCTYRWALGKTMFRTDRCSKSYLHWCVHTITGALQTVSMKEGFMAHYVWRFKEKVASLTDEWNEERKQTFELYDQTWFSIVRDTSLTRFVNPLLQSVEKFNKNL